MLVLSLACLTFKLEADTEMYQGQIGKTLKNAPGLLKLLKLNER